MALSPFKRKLFLNQLLINHFKLTIFLVVVIILVLSSYFILLPKYQRIAIGGEYDLKTIENNKQSLEQYLADLKKLDKTYRQITSSQKEKLYKILPKEKEIAELFIQLAAIAEKNNFILLNINVNEQNTKKTKSTTSDNIRKLDINMNLVGGDYSALKKFLHDVESSLRLLDIKTISFNPDSNYYLINLVAYFHS